jgi:hypothetical protein
LISHSPRLSVVNKGEAAAYAGANRSHAASERLAGKRSVRDHETDRRRRQSARIEFCH